MNRAAQITKTLLELSEDIETRLPGLRARYGQNYSDEDIRAIAEADPTKDTSCEYTTWLLEMRRSEQWTGVGSGDITEMRKLLERFIKNKSKKRFAQVGGKKDITQYATVAELKSHVEAAEAWDDATADAGTKGLNKIGDLLLLKVTNFDAAKRAAIEPGWPNSTAGWEELQLHAGTGEPGWPWSVWCTQKDSHYRYYSEKGPIYPIKKGKVPFVQVSFGHPQLRDIRNEEITPEVLEAIKPLFDVPEFDYLGERLIDEVKLKDKCLTMIRGYVNRYTQGFTKPAQGEGAPPVHIPPVGDDPERAKAELVPRIPRFYNMFVEIAQHWGNPVDERDRVTMRDIAADKRQQHYGEVQPLVDAIREMRPAQVLPPMLASLETFTNVFAELMQSVGHVR